MATTASITRLLTQSGAARAKKIPESLIYETIDGKPFYKKGIGMLLPEKKRWKK